MASVELHSEGRFNQSGIQPCGFGERMTYPSSDIVVTDVLRTLEEVRFLRVVVVVVPVVKSRIKSLPACFRRKIRPFVKDQLLSELFSRANTRIRDQNGIMTRKPISNGLLPVPGCLRHAIHPFCLHSDGSFLLGIANTIWVGEKATASYLVLL